MFRIVSGVDLYEDINKYDVILVGTNIYCNMSQGFQRKVMLNYSYVEDKNMATKYGDESKLGTILECEKEGKPTFVLLYINKGNFRPDLKKDYLSYESLEKCLKLVNVLYKGKKLACTFLGASKFDGNGDKDRIFEIISKTTDNIDLTVYDYVQLSRSEEMKKIRISELKLKEIDMDAYYDAVKKRKQEADERFKNNGHARY
jgi:hypothetical protein